MDIFSDLQGLNMKAKGATLILGSFDGVHRGHQALAAAARARSHAAGVLTFSPHPRLLFHPDQVPFLLTPGKEKHVALGALGIDFCVELPFTRELASIPAEAFVEDILVQHLTPKHIVVGDNFRFGSGRKGDVALLRELGLKFGFTVDHVGPVSDGSGKVFSSTRVRDCLRAGDVASAREILGRPWAIKVLLQMNYDGGIFFRFGDHLKPLPGYYTVKLRSADGSGAEALLTVSQNDDTGSLEFGDGPDLRRPGLFAIEFAGFVGSLTNARPRREARADNVCYI